MNYVAQSLFATLFPSDCRFCNAPLVNISRLPVCEECLSAIRPIAGGVCAVCGERVEAFGSRTEPDLRCGVCRRLAPHFEKAMAYGSYSGGLRELIHLLKYERVRPAADVLGPMLAETIAKQEWGGPVVVIPVPLHASKMRQRGFNQAELIAQAAMKIRKEAAFRMEPNVLKRRRPTDSQMGLSRHQRRQNIRGAFSVVKPEKVTSRCVLLVDDVMTTGATANECARVLRKAGASKVLVATVARTLKDQAAPVLKAVAEDQLAVAG